jgi:GMP synthase (glutamine-hydrolysing)
MSKAVILQHVEYEGPGRIVPVFRDFGIPTEVRHLYRGDEVPTDLDELRLLVVLGGPMGVADVGGEKYPFLAREVELLQRMVKVDRPVLGICLGAQLLAHAAGAKVYPNVKMAPPAGHGGAMMFHWHFDTFDLPKLPAPANPAPPPAPPPPTGNALLSSTRICRNQAFRFKNRLFGFQYHMEATPQSIEAFLAGARDDLMKVLGPDGVKKVREDTARYYPMYERLGNKILGNFVQFLKVY